MRDKCELLRRVGASSPLRPGERSRLRALRLVAQPVAVLVGKAGGRAGSGSADATAGGPRRWLERGLTRIHAALSGDGFPGRKVTRGFIFCLFFFFFTCGEIQITEG